MSMPKLNAPAEIHWRRSNMNTRDPILMKSAEVLKDCQSLNAAAEMNCPMPRSVEKVPIRNEKRCTSEFILVSDHILTATVADTSIAIDVMLARCINTTCINTACINTACINTACINTVSSLPGTLNFRIQFCHSTGIARSGGGVRASTTSYA